MQFLKMPVWGDNLMTYIKDIKKKKEQPSKLKSEINNRCKEMPFNCLLVIDSSLKTVFFRW